MKIKTAYEINTYIVIHSVKAVLSSKSDVATRLRQVIRGSAALRHIA